MNCYSAATIIIVAILAFVGYLIHFTDSLWPLLGLFFIGSINCTSKKGDNG